MRTRAPRPRLAATTAGTEPTEPAPPVHTRKTCREMRFSWKDARTHAASPPRLPAAAGQRSFSQAHACTQRRTSAVASAPPGHLSGSEPRQPVPRPLCSAQKRKQSSKARQRANDWGRVMRNKRRSNQTVFCGAHCVTRALDAQVPLHMGPIRFWPRCQRCP